MTQGMTPVSESRETFLESLLRAHPPAAATPTEIFPTSSIFGRFEAQCSKRAADTRRFLSTATPPFNLHIGGLQSRRI